MKRTILLISALLFAIVSNSQILEKQKDFNFDFEHIENKLPVNWESAGSKDYTISIDSLITKHGKYSAVIEINGMTADYKVLKFTLPENYSGKKITLSGYIKTEKVTDYWAGLWMRIDPSIAFENMQYNGIVGTTDWKRYEITLDMNPGKTKQISFGGALIGKGKMWLDDLNVSIDGIDIRELKPIPYAEEVVGEFDKRSKIDKIELDKAKIENLKTLGLIWGFLKYYHPAVAPGNYNWDYELFRILPKILDANDLKLRDEIYVKWINKLGEFEKAEKANDIKEEIKSEPDLDWIENNNLSGNLKSLLLEIKNAKRTDTNYYVSLGKRAGNPVFDNEATYEFILSPDAGYRILTLFRYWNFIQYFYPYKHLIGEDWENVLKEFIPKFTESTNETEYKLLILELIARIHDTHAKLAGGDETLNKYLGVNYTSAEVTFIENRAVVTYFYDEKLGKISGLQIGDVITKINNKPVEKIIDEKLKYTPASNYPRQLMEIAPNLLRTNDTLIQLEYFRDGNTYSKTIIAYPKTRMNTDKKHLQQDTCFKMINTDIAYIYPGTLKRDYLPEIWEIVEKTKGLIIDLRCYPKEFVLYNLCDYLMPDSTAFCKVTTGSIQKPGLFSFIPTLVVGKINPDYYKGKVVIIVNEKTWSQAEFTTMGLRVAPRAKVIGSTTAAADGDVSYIYLPGNILTYMTGIGIYNPDGSETQRVGIIPDIVIKPTINGIKNGLDELLEKAIEVISE